jgi:hypothetical protein
MSKVRNMRCSQLSHQKDGSCMAAAKAAQANAFALILIVLVALVALSALPSVQVLV